MKAFIGLLKMEQRSFMNVGLVFLVLSILGISIAPIIIHEYKGYLTVQGYRFTFMIFVTCIVFINSIVLFFSSLKKDINKKELWLHNSQSIVLLVLVKALYQGVQLIIICGVTFIGFFFVGEKLAGTAGQLLFFYSYCMCIIAVLYISIVVFALCFYATLLQCKRYMGKLGIIAAIAIAVVFLNFVEKLPSDFLAYGTISAQGLASNFPKFNNEVTIVMMDMHIASELFNIVFFILLFVLACKWIERVITR